MDDSSLALRVLIFAAGAADKECFDAKTVVHLVVAVVDVRGHIDVHERGRPGRSAGVHV